jgi:hypothetical protein
MMLAYSLHERRGPAERHVNANLVGLADSATRSPSAAGTVIEAMAACPGCHFTRLAAVFLDCAAKSIPRVSIAVRMSRGLTKENFDDSHFNPPPAMKSRVEGCGHREARWQKGSPLVFGRLAAFLHLTAGVMASIQNLDWTRSEGGG